MLTITITFDTEKERNMYVNKLFSDLLKGGRARRKDFTDEKFILKLDGMEDLVIGS